jgi:hypothetical protein
MVGPPAAQYTPETLKTQMSALGPPAAQYTPETLKTQMSALDHQSSLTTKLFNQLPSSPYNLTLS